MQYILFENFKVNQLFEIYLDSVLEKQLFS